MGRADGQETTDGWCRGLLIWAKPELKAGRYESDLIKDMVECEGITLPWGKPGSILTILLAYRPPRYPRGISDLGFTDMFCELLTSINGQVLVCGDLNYSGIDWDRLHAVSPAERKVLEVSQTYFWTQYVDFPTHIGGHSAGGGYDERNGKTLDLALCNSPDIVLGVTDQGLFSDHRMLCVDLVKPKHSTGQSHELVPDWSKADLDQIAVNLSAIDWKKELRGVRYNCKLGFLKKCY